MLTTAQAPTLHLSRSEAEDFLFRQAEYIDRRDYEAWLSLFTPDGLYWIPARPGDTDPETELSFMFDDLPMMVARAERLLAQRATGYCVSTTSTGLIVNRSPQVEIARPRSSCRKTPKTSS